MGNQGLLEDDTQSATMKEATNIYQNVGTFELFEHEQDFNEKIREVSSHSPFRLLCSKALKMDVKVFYENRAGERSAFRLLCSKELKMDAKVFDEDRADERDL